MVATRDVVDAPELDDAPGSAQPRPWYDTLEFWASLTVVAVCCAYVLSQLRPGLLLLDTTAAGGDTGAHVWFPAFLRDHLLPWRLTGWSPDYYAGFPAGQFYFPFPALLIVTLDLVMPYNVAFKLVTALGPVALPAAAYVFGRGIRAPRPAPALFAVGATGFLFFKDGGDATMRFDHHIMGGTLTSTLAGEYSFTIALALALCFLGTLARALEVERRSRVNLWLPALLLAATAMSHLVVAVFAVYAGAVLWLLRHPLRSFTRAAAVAVVGGLLTAVWLLPLATSLGLTTDMRYEPIHHQFDWMFLSEMWFLYPLAAVAIGGGIAYRRRATLDVVAILVAAGLVFRGWELLRDVLGKAPAWNLRLLPFWYLMLYLLAALGAAELARWAGVLASWLVYGPEPLDDPPLPAGEDAVTQDAVTESPVEERTRRGDDRSRAAVRVVAIVATVALFGTVALVRVHATRGYQPYWAKYNYTGYEGGEAANFTLKSWPEYHAFMDTAAALPPGRMFWEGNSGISTYGTPLALMLLPYWTDGRITSMEGLYYEAAGTTGYHFLAAATLTPQPSNAVRGLPYRSFADFDLGVQYLQLLGVRYYAATTPEANAKAAANPALHQVATVPDIDNAPPNGWTIYEVSDSETVAPLSYEPVVATDLHEAPNWECEGRPEPPPDTVGVTDLGPWECLGVPWFNDPAALDRPLTDDGPASWKRAPMLEARNATKKPLPTVDVTNIHTTDEKISFDVSRTGVPVMVKTSYYPNWQVSGADGPYRATPNFMVVVPTSRHVELAYGTTSVEWAGRILTLVGVVGVGFLVWWGRRLSRRRRGDPVRSRTPRRVRFPLRSAQER
ncbi:MAG: hypothetical protein ABW033_09975 [Acidimicrobiia bacterium]